jgi:hypothetical protein
MGAMPQRIENIGSCHFVQPAHPDGCKVNLQLTSVALI